MTVLIGVARVTGSLTFLLVTHLSGHLTLSVHSLAWHDVRLLLVTRQLPILLNSENALTVHEIALPQDLSDVWHVIEVSIVKRIFKICFKEAIIHQ